jgi:flagellar biosynthesis/type III secretory pathway M-ring protein FliF/YscJ
LLYFEREHIVKNFVLGVMTCIIVGPVVREVIIKTTERMREATAAREAADSQPDAPQA